MRLIVCGGHFADRERIFQVLDLQHARCAIATIVHGGAGGADIFASEWAEARGVRVKVFPADWKRLGFRAGSIRNQQIVDAGADGCIALPDGADTEDMCRRASLASIPVWRPLG